MISFIYLLVHSFVFFKTAAGSGSFVAGVADALKSQPAVHYSRSFAAVAGRRSGPGRPINGARRWSSVHIVASPRM